MGGGGGGGIKPEKLGGGESPLLKALNLFMTKICDFCYPIKDLDKNLIPFYDHCGWFSCHKHKEFC